MFLSLAISLVYSWMLTLVLMGFIPVFIFAGFVQFRATTEGLKTSNAATNVAGKVRWSFGLGDFLGGFIIFGIVMDLFFILLDCY